MLEVVKKPHDPTYTVFVPFTRLWFVEAFLENLIAMDMPLSSCELVFYNDTDNKELHDKLYNWLHEHAPSFNGATLATSGRPLLSEYEIIPLRRERIVGMLNISRQYFSNSTYLFMIEDDTVAPVDSFTRLLEHMTRDDTIAIASGIEVGRWSVSMIGAWEIKPLINPLIVKTVPYREYGVQYVDASGFYCMLTRTELFKSADFRFSGECFGPDVCYGYDLRKKGYNVLIDWSLPCTHMLMGGSLVPSKYVEIAEFHNIDGGWVYQEIPTIAL